MINRIRDRIRQYKPQQVIPFSEWQTIEDQAAMAADFMHDSNPMYQIMSQDLKGAETIVLQNRVHEVREVRVISEFLQKIFIIRKEEQMNELVGQIKYLREFFAELQSWIDRKTQLEKMEADGVITIRRNEEEPKNV